STRSCAMARGLSHSTSPLARSSAVGSYRSPSSIDTSAAARAPLLRSIVTSASSRPDGSVDGARSAGTMPYTYQSGRADDEDMKDENQECGDTTDTTRQVSTHSRSARTPTGGGWTSLAQNWRAASVAGRGTG